MGGSGCWIGGRDEERGMEEGDVIWRWWEVPVLVEGGEEEGARGSPGRWMEVDGGGGGGWAGLDGCDCVKGVRASGRIGKVRVKKPYLRKRQRSVI